MRTNFYANKVRISPIHAEYKLGFSQPVLRCDCGARLDLNRESNKTKAGEAFRVKHEECKPGTQDMMSG